MKIVHFSDPHAGGPAEDFMAYIDKRWVGVFNYRFRRRFRHDLRKLEQTVDYILKIHPDVAVCTGDLTSTGQPGEFQKVLDILKPLRDSEIPLLYLPGNHDCYVRQKKCVKAMHDAVDYCSKGIYQFSDLPLKRTIGECDFLLLNTSRPSNLLCSWGFVSRADRDWVLEECAQLKQRPRILISHYPMIAHNTLWRTRHRLFGQKAIVEQMNLHHIDLTLCGHVHVPFCNVDATGRGENCAGSVTRNGTLSLIEYDPQQDMFHYQRIDLNQRQLC